MAEYSTLKVPELKKLLSEKGLAQTGNKAELVARLKENDEKDAPAAEKPAENKEDEISYSDDEAAAAPEPKAAAAEPAAPGAEPVADVPAAAETTEKPAETEEATEKPDEEAAAEPAQNFAIGLSSTAADEEAKKRADRAKRFGIEEEDDTKKRADRAQRFGIDEKSLAKGLDSALPERSLKRGRGRAEGAEGNRPEKRQNSDRRGGNRRNNNNDNRNGGNNNNNNNRRSERRGNGSNKPSIQQDPAEKAKAEARAARFATN